MKNGSKAIIYILVFILIVMIMVGISPFFTMGFEIYPEMITGLLMTGLPVIFFMILAGMSKADGFSEEQFDHSAAEILFGGCRVYLTTGFYILLITELAKDMLFDRGYGILIIASWLGIFLIIINIVGAVCAPNIREHRSALYKSFIGMTAILGGGIGVFLSMRRTRTDYENFFLKKLVGAGFMVSFWFETAVPFICAMRMLYRYTKG